MRNRARSAPVPGRFLAKRHWVLGVVLIVGLALSWVGYRQSIDQNRHLVSAELIEDGESLYRSIVDDAAVAVAQVRAVEGLFRASELVTAAEFQSFVGSLGSTPLSSFFFAELSHSGTSESWPVSYAVFLKEVGDGVGFDLGSDPEQLAAIQQTVATGALASTGFIEVKGDSQAGDIALFQSVVSRAPGQQGVVGAIVQLDELIAQRASTLLSDGQEWLFTELTDSVAHPHSLSVWSAVVEISGRAFLLSISSTESHAVPDHALLVLLGGGFLTVLVGLLAEVIARQRQSNKELTWLRRSSEDKDRFLSGVAHELRTPLAAVVGMLDLVTNDSHRIAPVERRDLLMVAREQAHELAGVVDDFMVAGRLAANALNVRTVESKLSPLLADVAAEVRQYRAIEIILPTDLGVAVADEVRLRQIIRNLFSFVIRNGASFIDISSDLEGRQISLDITSDSSSLFDANQERLFEPFAAPPRQGQPQPIELGLAVSRSLARRMRGDLTYRVADGKATFTLKLPTFADAMSHRAWLDKPAPREFVHR